MFQNIVMLVDIIYDSGVRVKACCAVRTVMPF